VRRLLLLLLLLPALPGCGYGLTALMWNSQRSHPLDINNAVLTTDATLFADVDTTIGPLRVVKIADVSDDMMQVVEAHGRLPPGRAVTIRDLPLESSDPESFAAGTWLWLGPDGHTDGQLVLAVRNGTRFRENSIWYRRPIDFSRWQAWGAVVATPVTVVLDLIVIGPTEVIWSIVTVGQHGALWPFNEQ
jgi:hypothetical protein